MKRKIVNQNKDEYNMDGNLKIIIEGKYGCGETTLSLMIADFLREKGFSSVKVETYPDFNNEGYARLHYERNKDSRVEAITKATKSIIIEQKQLPRV